MPMAAMEIEDFVGGLVGWQLDSISGSNSWWQQQLGESYASWQCRC